MARPVYNRKVKSWFYRILRPKILLLALLVVIMLRIVILRDMDILSNSMEPLLKHNKEQHDKVIYIRYFPPLFKPRRGDIVIYKINGSNGEFGKTNIGRVAALSGEKIFIKNKKLFIDGKKLKTVPFNEIEYIYSRSMKFGSYKKVLKVDRKSYFILGDNTTDSYDSRYVGAVHQSDIVGKVICIYWPFTRLSLIDSNVINEQLLEA